MILTSIPKFRDAIASKNTAIKDGSILKVFDSTIIFLVNGIKKLFDYYQWGWRPK